MVEYNFVEIFRVLLRKWYIIFICCAVLGIVAMPLAEWSYERALSDYDELHLDDQTKYTKIYAYGDVEERIVQHYMEVLEDSQLMEDVLNNNQSPYEWKSFESKIQLMHEATIDVFTVVMFNIDEQQRTFLEKVIVQWIPDYLRTHYEQEIQLTEMIQESFNVSERSELEQKLISGLIKEPVSPGNGMGIIIKACILGGVLGAFISIVCDYIQKMKDLLVE